MHCVSPAQRRIVLPHLLDGWPFPRTVNPHLASVAADSEKWIADFHALDPRRQAVFADADLALFAALSYPRFDAEQLRTACDFMHTVFLLDDVTDGRSKQEVCAITGVVLDSLRHPDQDRPAGEHVLGEIFKGFWSRASKTIHPRMIPRFVAHYDEYMGGVVQEAEDHSARHIRSISAYLELRSKTAGTTPSLDVLAFFLDIQDDLLDHPTVRHLMTLSSQLIYLMNDIMSYDKEQRHGLGCHNMVVVVMQEKGLDVQAAVDFIGAYCGELKQDFIATARDLPQCDDPRVARDLAVYVQGLGNWVTAFHAWAFESKRYFGADGPEIAKHRVVNLH